MGLALGVDPVEFGGDQLRIGTQGIQPIDDEAPQPGVGTVPQQGPDLLSFAHANQGDRRPCLTLGKSVLDLLLDHGAVPDRGGHQRSLGCGLAHRPRYGAVTLGDQFPAFSQVGGGIKTVDRSRLEARIAAPCGGIAAVGVTSLHDLGERRVVPDRVEVGVLIHLAEIGIVVLDRLL